MSDILQEAETLIEKHTTSGYIHRDATLLLPGLVSEIKRLQDENDYLRNGTCLGCVAKLEELAKWQQIAIQQRALINFIEGEERYAYSEHVILSDDEISIATKDLGLQLEQEAGYVERLERLALSLCMEAGWDQEDFEAALEKIRRG